MNTQRFLALLTCLLVLKVTASIVLGYGDYFPPNFDANFLRGRETYFFGPYRWPFYAHILAGPLSLLLGLILLSERFRLQFPGWHRSIGKIQILLVAALVAPSGLWMSFYAESGAIAGVGFAVLAIATATSALFGWLAAVQRRFAEHRRWMMRCFLLLSSAVTIRMIGGLFTVLAVDASWIYPLSAWLSWLVPLAVYELTICFDCNYGHNTRHTADQSLPLSAALSAASNEMSARRESFDNSL
jgi:hypothetical protein